MHAPALADEVLAGAAEDHDVCYRQPRSEEDWEAAREAAESCPTESIGLDG
ncbi:MAG: ferredoxin [Alphaproteobacteria bacterium]|nr:ferredoxin [Alphaproteobacteria bacterium]